MAGWGAPRGSSHGGRSSSDALEAAAASPPAGGDSHRRRHGAWPGDAVGSTPERAGTLLGEFLEPLAAGDWQVHLSGRAGQAFDVSALVDEPVLEFSVSTGPRRYRVGDSLELSASILAAAGFAGVLFNVRPAQSWRA